MVFSSVIYLFLFLPAALLCYFAVPRRFLRARNIVLLAFSLAFYHFGEPKAVWLMLALIAADYVFGLVLQRRIDGGEKPKALLALCVAANLAALVYFKYLNFIVDNVNAAFGASFHIEKIIMPIGVSFFTFQAMSYVFDIWQGKARACKNPLDVALYVSMFPQLVAGPIVRYDMVAKEIQKRSVTLEEFSGGVTRFICGLAKKVLLANTLGQAADGIFSTRGDVGTLTAWVGALAYAFQIFYDFSGYSDMAIGLGKMFGFNFNENFNYPYSAKSITDFWRRWHMSLSSWFRDYVYIPLGGSRVGKARNIFNIFAVWALTGLWHGAAWNFVVWGLYFAVILTLEKLFVLKFLKKAGSVVSRFYAILLILVGWVIFRSESLGGVADYLGKMFFPRFGDDSAAIYYLLEFKAEWIFALVISFPVSKVFAKFLGKRAFWPILRYAAVFAVFALSITSFIHSTFNPFIYFRF